MAPLVPISASSIPVQPALWCKGDASLVPVERTALQQAVAEEAEASGRLLTDVWREGRKLALQHTLLQLVQAVKAMPTAHPNLVSAK
jgi:hypothetical protein